MPAAARLSEAHLRERFGSGARLVDVAKDLGLARATVARHCRLHGIKYPTRRGPTPRLPKVEVVIAMLRYGIKSKDIASKFGVKHSAVYHLLTRNFFALHGGKVLHNCAVTPRRHTKPGSKGSTFALRGSHVHNVEHKVDAVLEKVRASEAKRRQGEAA